MVVRNQQNCRLGLSLSPGYCRPLPRDGASAVPKTQKESCIQVLRFLSSGLWCLTLLTQEGFAIGRTGQSISKLRHFRIRPDNGHRQDFRQRAVQP